MAERIGILGGLTPESTVTYYLHIVHSYQRRFGDHAFPEIVIYSLSFQRFEDWMEAGEWDRIAEALLGGLERLAAAGAGFAVMATNTMHLHYDRLVRESPIPLVSIIDVTAGAILARGLRSVGILGTRFTMEKPFYAEGLARHGITSLVPEKEDREYIHRVIMDELSRGVITEPSRRGYLAIIDKLTARGAEGIVLGCTEIPLLVRPEDTLVPLFDTAVLHAEAALERSLA
jgi:aspartate racemase